MTTSAEAPQRVLVDANILLLLAQPLHAEHQVVLDGVARLRVAGEILCVTPQSVFEAWSVMTRDRPPEANGLGFTFNEARQEADRMLRLFPVLPELPQVFAEWRRLVLAHRVLGRQVFDAKQVAMMAVHGIERILTRDARHFARYAVTVLDPATR
jgi:predicted nucleic acid-binding protein